MGIDKHLILTIKESGDRRRAVLGGATAMETPADKIEFIIGHNKKDYDEDSVTIANMAEADGFPFVRYFAGNLNTGWVQQSPGGMTLFWNYARVMRYIISTGQTYLLTWDDRVITVPYFIIEEVTRELENRNEPFYMWQLRIRGCWQDIYSSLSPLTWQEIHAKYGWPMPSGDFDYFEVENIKSTNTLFMNTVLNEQNDYYNTYLQKGILGYDESMVISPLGAQWLLDQMYAMEELDTMENFSFCGDVLKNPESLHRSRLNIDNWLCWGIRESIDHAITNEKGLYTTQKFGYNFIKGEKDWIPMGTLTDWCPECSDEYAESRYKPTIKFVK